MCDAAGITTSGTRLLSKSEVSSLLPDPNDDVEFIGGAGCRQPSPIRPPAIVPDSVTGRTAAISLTSPTTRRCLLDLWLAAWTSAH
jgi:hypothetical protein